MATLKFTEGDKLYVSEMLNNATSVVNGADGHYAVGAYYDAFGEKGNKEANVDASNNTKSAEVYMELTEGQQLAVGLL